MKVELKVTVDPETGKNEVVLPDNAILAAGMVELARQAVVIHRIVPLLVPKVQPVTQMPEGLTRGQA